MERNFFKNSTSSKEKLSFEELSFEYNEAEDPGSMAHSWISSIWETEKDPVSNDKEKLKQYLKQNK